MISVIIPIYNSEKFLKKCIDSVINQTYSDLEIILVNDASTDNSLEICRYYQNIDKRIKIIDIQNNCGQVHAYCKGIESCSGNLIAFVDSDDWIEPTMYEELKKSLDKNDSDISVCGCTHIYNSYSLIEPDNIKDIQKTVYSFNEIKESLYELHKIDNPVDSIIKLYRWNKLFKKELLLNNLKYLISEIKVFEDNNIVIPCIIDAKKFSYINKPLYNYRRRENSTMSLLDKRVLISNRKFLEIQEMIYKDKNIPHLMNSDVFVTSSYSISRILESNLSYKEKKDMLRYVYFDMEKYQTLKDDYTAYVNSKRFVYVYKLVSKKHFFVAIAFGYFNKLRNKVRR